MLVSQTNPSLLCGNYAKSFAYVNNMPWGHLNVNYKYKGPHWARPLHSTLGRRLE